MRKSVIGVVLTLLVSAPVQAQVVPAASGQTYLALLGPPSLNGAFCNTTLNLCVTTNFGVSLDAYATAASVNSLGGNVASQQTQITGLSGSVAALQSQQTIANASLSSLQASLTGLSGTVGSLGSSFATLQASTNASLSAVQASFGALSTQFAATSAQLAQALHAEARDSRSGVAQALAMAGTTDLQPDENYAVSMNVGTFGGQTAFASGVAARIAPHVSVNAGFTAGVNGGPVGGRAGVRFGW